jgi:hypothetical protein
MEGRHFLVDPDELQKNLVSRGHYAHLSQEQKKVILGLKDARNKGELPSTLSSAVLYDAVLEHNIKSLEQFKQTLA